MVSKSVPAVRSVRIALAAGVAGLALLASPVLVPGHAQANTPLLQGQVSLADLVDKVMPAVVNISAVTTNDQKGRNLPQLPQVTVPLPDTGVLPTPNAPTVPGPNGTTVPAPTGQRSVPQGYNGSPYQYDVDASQPSVRRPRGDLRR